MSEAAASSPADSWTHRSGEFGFVPLNRPQLQRVPHVAETGRFNFLAGRINVDSAVIAPIDQPNLLSASSGEVA
jgi:hypothetical protein